MKLRDTQMGDRVRIRIDNAEGTRLGHHPAYNTDDWTMLGFKPGDPTCNAGAKWSANHPIYGQYFPAGYEWATWYHGDIEVDVISSSNDPVIISITKRDVVSAGMNCCNCGDWNAYAIANCKNNSFACWSCRQTKPWLLTK
jgi:hypothetical protein